MEYKLPVLYDKLSSEQRRMVRELYVLQQKGRCMYCNELLTEDPPIKIQNLPISWDLFPPKFRDYPVHLQHNHETGYTEGAVHMKCNAVLWEYEGR